MVNYIVTVGVAEEQPAWLSTSPEEQGYTPLNIPKLIRQNSKRNEYLVFRNKNEFVCVEADSALNAAIISDIKSPHKIVNLWVLPLNVVSREELKYSDEHIEEVAQQGAIIVENNENILPIPDNNIDTPPPTNNAETQTAAN